MSLSIYFNSSDYLLICVFDVFMDVKVCCWSLVDILEGYWFLPNYIPGDNTLLFFVGLVSAQLIQKIPLTRGEWSVTSGGLWVDEQHNLVYFTGLRDSPLEHHLYVASISHPGLIQRLTEPGFSHQVAINDVSSLIDYTI